MHTLRYAIGDSVFFPALKQLATAPEYCYDNLVNTDDVEQLFSKAAGYSVKPLFDLFIRSTKKMEVQITAMANNEYKIQLVNINMPLPVEILTEKGIEKIIVDKEGVVIKSDVLPQIDPDSYYLKKVIIE